MKKEEKFHSSELVKQMAKIYGFEDILKSFKIKDFLREYLNEILFAQIESVKINGKILVIKIKSPLLKNDFKLRKSFYLAKILRKAWMMLRLKIFLFFRLI